MTSHLGSALLALSIASAATGTLVAARPPSRKRFWKVMAFELVMQLALIVILIRLLVG